MLIRYMFQLNTRVVKILIALLFFQNQFKAKKDYIKANEDHWERNWVKDFEKEYIEDHKVEYFWHRYVKYEDLDPFNDLL